MAFITFTKGCMSFLFPVFRKKFGNPWYNLSNCPSPTGGLRRVTDPIFGYKYQIDVFESYQISTNILVRPLNLTSDAICVK